MLGRLNATVRAINADRIASHIEGATLYHFISLTSTVSAPQAGGSRASPPTHREVFGTKLSKRHESWPNGGGRGQGRHPPPTGSCLVQSWPNIMRVDQMVFFKGMRVGQMAFCFPFPSLPTTDLQGTFVNESSLSMGNQIKSNQICPWAKHSHTLVDQMSWDSTRCHKDSLSAKFD